MHQTFEPKHNPFLGRPYTLALTDEDIDACQFVYRRYSWGTAILDICSEGENELTESEGWTIAEAIEEDMEGGHSPFPCLDPDSELYEKLLAFWDSIV